MTAALAATVLLGGCLSLGGKVPAELISLTPDESAPVGEMPGGRQAEALVVLDPDTSRLLDVQRVPVHVNDAAVAYLKDAMWVERPARQLRRLLAETIRARGKRLVLEGDDTTPAGSTMLSGRLLAMGYDAGDQSVIVRFDALRAEKGGAIQSRRFEARVPGVEAKAAPVGRALNQAANQVAKEVADWVG